MPNRTATQSGITLLEIIAFIVVFGVAASYLVSYMSSTVPQSAQPYVWIQQENDMGNEMEEVVSTYIADVNDDTTAFSYTDFYDTLDTSGSDYSVVTKDYVCFDDTGAMTTSCTDQGIVLVSITDPNGRVQHALFSKTREANESYRRH